MKIILIAYGVVSAITIVVLVVLYFKRKNAKNKEDFERRDN
jgi:flagellar basal body-associated protein FliL